MLLTLILEFEKNKIEALSLSFIVSIIFAYHEFQQ